MTANFKGQDDRLKVEQQLKQETFKHLESKQYMFKNL